MTQAPVYVRLAGLSISWPKVSRKITCLSIGILHNLSQECCSLWLGSYSGLGLASTPQFLKQPGFNGFSAPDATTEVIHLTQSHEEPYHRAPTQQDCFLLATESVPQQTWAPCGPYDDLFRITTSQVARTSVSATISSLPGGRVSKRSTKSCREPMEGIVFIGVSISASLIPKEGYIRVYTYVRVSRLKPGGLGRKFCGF